MLCLIFVIETFLNHSKTLMAHHTSPFTGFGALRLNDTMELQESFTSTTTQFLSRLFEACFWYSLFDEENPGDIDPERLEQNYLVAVDFQRYTKQKLLEASTCNLALVSTYHFKKEIAMFQEDLNEIELLYQNLYRCDVRVSQFVRRLKKVEYLNQVLGISDY